MPKSIYILFLLCALSAKADAQSLSQNYVLGKQMLDAEGTRAITSVTYYDGLGYPIETATNGLGGTGKYAYTLLEYDLPGRTKREWLAGAIGSDCSFVPSSELSSSLTAYHKDQNPYTVKESDVLDREGSILGPGEHWHTAQKKVVRQYSSNQASSIKYYQVNSSGVLVLNGYYAANALTMEKTTDEEGKSLQVFTDLFGQKVLERRADANDIYYVYNNLGQLRFVLSPSYQEEADLQKFGYEYRYDKYGRCVWKRLPGCEYQQMWYDEADNLMFSQDGEQRKKGNYLFYLYDNMRRLVLQGSTSSINASCASAIVSSYKISVAGVCGSGYTPLGSLGLKNEQLLVANYYDSHVFLKGTLVGQSTSQKLSVSGIQESNSLGSLTGIVTRATNGELLCSAYYHDLRGLVVKSRQTKLGDILLSQDVTYSFTKKPLVITSTIQRGKVCKSVIQTNTYNRYNDQLATIGLQAGGSERVIASYAYDDVGKLVNIGRSGSAGNIRKEYNVRGWLQSIKTPRFSESLSYETQAAHPRYDGNVSRLQWQSGKDNILRGYDFKYDDLNRLTDSYYAEGTGMSQNKDHYSEKGIEYSSNGCIEKMQRYGRKNDNTFGLIDDLSYLYNGNQVKSISDKAGSLVYNGSFDFKDGASASTEYSYNVNGAIVKDLNKGINGIEYDVLGNLNSITFGNGFKTKYVYDAIGNKLQTTHVGAVTSTTDYCGNFIFEDGKLVKYLFDGGYCSFDVNLNPTYHYYEKDHLGSVRMVVNENGTIEQVNHYYPFGGLYGDLSYNSESQRNKYIGKEFDHTFGLDLYDHGARMYDAARGGWDRMEPLYGKYYSYCPYAYCGNNSVNAIDLDGCKVIAMDDLAKRNILNTLTRQEQEYVKFDQNGQIDISLMNKSDGSSLNFIALRTLANSQIKYKFAVSDRDVNGNVFYEKGTKKDSPENYSYGVTNLPKAVNDPSPDNDVYIFTAFFLDEKAQAKNTAHEGYGHAYFYELKQSNSSIEPSHTFGIVGYSKEFDNYYQKVVSYPIFGKNNKILEQQIKLVEQQAIDNYEKNH